MICESAMPRVVELGHLHDLENMQLKWQAFVSQMPAATVFHTLDWLQIYRRRMEVGQRLRVLAVASGPHLVGILPLTVRSEQTPAGRLRVLTYPVPDWCDFFSPVGPNPTATLTLGLAHLQSTPRDWDVLDLRWIDRDEQDHGRTRWALEHAGFTVRESLWRTIPIIALAGSWSDYWGTRAGALRGVVADAEARLRRCGTLEYVRYRPAGRAVGDDDPQWTLFDSCVEMARKSAHATRGPGSTLADVATWDTLRSLHVAAAKHGMLDLNLLLVDRRPVAFQYGYVQADRVLEIQHGSLAEPALAHVADVLLARMLQDSCERGDRVVHLCPRASGATAAWCTAVKRSYRCTHYSRRAPRAQLLRLQTWTRGLRAAAAGTAF
jgi:hypothetical protein